jgi:hypothetical protein
MAWWDDLSYSDRRALISDVRAFRGEPLAIIIKKRFQDLADAAQTDLENPKSTESEFRFAQGERKVAKCGIMVIEDLLRTLEKLTQRSRQEDTKDAR